MEASSTLKFEVPASDTWKLNKNFNLRSGIQRLWLSPKLIVLPDYKFQIKLVKITFQVSGGRTSELSQLFLVNCKMRKVRVDKFDFKVTYRQDKRTYVADLDDVELKRSGVVRSSSGITFDKDLFHDPSEILVRITVARSAGVSLRDDLNRQLIKELKDPLFADTVLEIGDKELNCHGFMLAARSKVFNACLTQTGFVEGESRRIKIDDMSVDAANQLLKFIYTDAFDADDDNIFDLFMAADKYDIPGLKDKCRDLLVADLDVSSAADCFRLAFLARCPELLEKSLNIIADNLDEVKDTDGWKSLDDREVQQVLNLVQSFDISGDLESLLRTLKLQ